MDPTGKETVLYKFKGGTDGAAPTAGNGLLMDADGNLYGVASYGGEFGHACEVADGQDNYGCGTVFKLASDGNVYSAARIPQRWFRGSDLNGGLVSDPAGNLYGTTSEESLVEGIGGTVFKLSPAGKLTVLYNFEGTDSPTGDSFETPLETFTDLRLGPYLS